MFAANAVYSQSVPCFFSFIQPSSGMHITFECFEILDVGSATALYATHPIGREYFQFDLEILDKMHAIPVTKCLTTTESFQYTDETGE